MSYMFCIVLLHVLLDTLCFKPWKASGLVAKLQVPGCPVWPVKSQRDPTAVAIAAGQAGTVTGQRSSKQGLSGRTKMERQSIGQMIHVNIIILVYL